jgi:2-polyprenyl-3-methyl-5-hydroxy-6-metoxy-1,4-benzoquinol methylase
MTNFETIKEKWDDENIPSNYNHTDINEQRDKDYIDYVINLSKLDFKDKIVIDYGCGGGWLGKLLLEKYEIKQYIGYDVSNNSLKFARENLKEFSNKKLIRIKDWIELPAADIFISLSCVQHFPDIEYVKKWLEMVNNSKCNDLIIHYRWNKRNKIEFIDKKVYTWACFLPKDWIDSFLKNYERWGGYNVIKQIANRYAFFKRENESINNNDMSK